MPNVITEELCRDVMVPVSIPSCTSKGRKKIYDKYINPMSKPSSTHVAQNINVSEPNSKEKILTISNPEVPVFIDSGVNTLITQTLHCRKECVEKHGICNRTCNCGNRKPNFQKSDKACTHFIETSNCGTQFTDQSRSCIMRSKPIPDYAYGNIIKQIQQPYERIKDAIEQLNHVLMTKTRIPKKPEVYMPSNFIYFRSKRWAISRNPIRGPDF